VSTATSPGDGVLHFGVFELDLHSGELCKSGHKTALRPQAVKVLALLTRRPAQLVTREELKDEIWGPDTFVDFEHGLNLCIRQIRAALGDDADTPRFIETLPRRGYRFIAPVQNNNGQTEPSSTEIGSDARRDAAAEPNGSHRLLWTGLAVVAAIIVGFAGTLAITTPLHWRAVLLGDHSSPVPATTASAESARRMLVVLPFDNLSGSSKQDYFSAGLTEEITTQLSELVPARLGVIARTSAVRYKQSGKPISDIGHDLGAEYVVEGGVLRARNRVRVTVQLIRVRDQSSVWAEEFEGELRDVVILQAKIAQAIARGVGVTLTMPEQTRLASARIVNADAHEAYLRGVYELRKNTAESLENAIQYFQQALAREPDNAIAYVRLAEAYYYQSTIYKPPLAVMPQAKAAAARAIELDETVADAHASLGKIKLSFDWDWPGAEREFRRALELNPNLSSAHAGYAEYLQTQNRGDDAIRELRCAQELDPLLPVAHGHLPLYLFELRRYDQAVEAAHRSTQTDEGALPLALAELGRSAEAIDAADRIARSTSNPITISEVAAAFALAGRKDKAKELLQQIEGQAAQRYICGMNLGGLYAVLGDRERALASLEQGYRDRSD
jgi:TolB-like protein/DNA-binding winged helix-turn-helix (wHTH) protein/Flp pilus assembly protein TadD